MSRFQIRTGAIAAGIAVTLLPPLLPAQQSDALKDELVTFARKREESLQDAPVAVSTFTGEALEFRGVTTIDKLDQFVPNLVLNNSPTFSNVTSNAAVYIRGIGQQDFVPTIDPAVGIYVDGVYLGRSVGAVLDIVDVETVEVLRGPQGTLFGRNTIGGAVTLTTVKPNEERGGKVSVKYGTDDRMNVQASLNLPITDTLYSRFTFASFQQDGYVTRAFDGVDLGNDDTIALRGALRWVPSDNLTIDWSVDFSRDRENGSAAVLTGAQPINFDLATNPNGGPSMLTAANTIAAQLASGGIMPDGEFFNPVNPPTGFPFNFLACFQPNNATNPLCLNEQFFDDGGKSVNYGTDPTFANLDTRGTSLSVEWNINDSLTLRSITAFREFDGLFSGDEDGTPVRGSLLIDPYEQEQFSQELQLLGSLWDDRVDWIVGAYYFEEEGFNINPVRFSQVEIQSGGFFEADSWAVFAQTTIALTDFLDLTLGGRYTEDTRDYLPDQFFEAFPIGPLPFTCPPGQPVPPAAPCAVGDRVLPFEWVTTEAEEFVPMFNLAWQVSDNLLTYFTYSEGYRSGGFTQRIFPPEASTPDFQPEFVTSYEVGAKYNSPNDVFRLNAALFLTDYEDQQLLVADPTRIGPFVTNAGDSEFQGLELELYLNPADGLFITGSLGWLDQERESLSGNVLGLSLNSRFEQVSEWTANAQIYREFQVGQLGYLTPRLEWAFRSDYGTNQNGLPRDGADVVPGNPFADANGTLGHGVANPRLVQDDLHLFNASVLWAVNDSDLSVSVGVDNITDEEFKNLGNYQDGFGWTTEIFDRGRQWYVQVDYEFK